MLLGSACCLKSACCLACRMRAVSFRASTSFSSPAMFGGRSDILFGLSQSMKVLLSTVCPFLAEQSFLEDSCGRRDLDFVEVFAGKGELSAAMRVESCHLMRSMFIGDYVWLFSTVIFRWVCFLP